MIVTMPGNGVIFVQPCCLQAPDALPDDAATSCPATAGSVQR